MNEIRICKKCGMHPTYRNRAICKVCHNEESRIRMNRLNRRLTPDEYVAMLDEQDYKCAICNLPEMATRNGVVKELAEDHCHDTGFVRGLLCCKCNTAIGLLNDDPELIEKVLEYLRVFKETAR